MWTLYSEKSLNARMPENNDKLQLIKTIFKIQIPRIYIKSKEDWGLS